MKKMAAKARLENKKEAKVLAGLTAESNRIHKELEDLLSQGKIMNFII